MSLVTEAWDMDFGFLSAYPLHPSPPCSSSLASPDFPPAGPGHCWTVMTGKGSEIVQGQCCRPGLERLLFGLCLPKQIL